MFDFRPENLDREFPVRKNLVYLNHAALAPHPRRVAEAIRDHVDDVSGYGAKNWKTWFRRYDETREAAAAFVGGDAARIAFLPSTSHALNLVAQGIEWRPGDNVVGDDMEFPANVYPWMNLASRGVEYRAAKNREGVLAAEDFAALIDARTRVVAVSWVAFHSGFVYPLEEIAALCRKRDAILVVDAIQGLGALPIDVGRIGIDVLAADSHKFLYGPEAATLFAYSEKARQIISPPWVGWWNVPWRASQLDYRLEPYETGRRFEPGSLPTAQLFGLSAALGLLSEIGAEAARQRIAGIVGRLRHGLRERGWSIRTPEGSSSAILSASPPSESALAAVQRLERHGIIASPRESAVRFSPHVGNDETEIDRALASLDLA